MNISAVNCTPIKPRASFRGNSETHSKSEKCANASDNQNEGQSNSKSLLDLLGTGALLLGIAIKCGKYAGDAFKKYLIPEKFANSTVRLLKSGAGKTAEYAQKLIKSNSKLQKYTGEAIGLANNGAKSIYKFITNNAQTPVDAWGNTVKNITTAGIVCGVVTRDSNNNKKLDIFERGQNAYLGAESDCKGIKETVNKVIEAFT